MKLRMDFHMHTFYSNDGIMSPEELISYAKDAGLNTICVTDHNTTRGGIKAKKLSKKMGMNIIVGQETRTKDGEILVYGLKEPLEKGRGLIETCKKAKALGGYIIVPHPFDRLRNGAKPKEILEYIDAIEVFNSRNLFNKSNKKARNFAEDKNVPMVAGSDAHSRYDVGNAVNIIDAQPNVKSIFDSLKKRNPEMKTKKFSIPFYFLYQLKRIKKKF